MALCVQARVPYLEQVLSFLCQAHRQATRHDPRTFFVGLNRESDRMPRALTVGLQTRERLGVPCHAHQGRDP